MSVAPLQLLKSEFNPLVYVFLDNATDKLVSGAFYYGATTTTPADAYFTKGAILVQATDGVIYINTAADGVTPTWNSVGNITPSEITLADGKVLIGGVSGLAAAQSISGDITISNTGVAAIGSNKVLKAMLAPAITPSHIVVFSGKHSYAGGVGAVTITVTGLLATDIVFAQTESAANLVNVVKVTPSADTITIELDGNPGASVFSYQALRATS